MFMRRGRVAFSSRRLIIATLVWLLSLAWLGSWWFSPNIKVNPGLYIPLTFALFYEYVVMPGAFLYFLSKARYPANRRAKKGYKVAVITPCVPAKESIDIVERQLKALSEINYPHDSWILDEGNDKRIQILSRKYGVKYFTRKGVPKYNQTNYPFKAKSKAGNVNAWLDKVRYRRYDFFVQMDIDHVPSPDYLDKTLGHFRDDKVGWVQAPSVYNNLNFWTARGSTEQDMGLQGPLQMGFFGSGKIPIIIGSHTTFRTKAINEIGGFQPTRAEDHLNTLALIDKDWRGVYIPEVIAKGDGPETFDAYLSQQYAWAFSMFQILKIYSWSFLKNMSVKMRLQLLFIQTWYPIWTLSYLIMFLVPIIGLTLNTNAIDSEGGDFIIRFTPAFLATLVIWKSARPLLRPTDLGLSWRGMILHVIRWPVILMAIISAGLGRQKPYQITPKGKGLKSIPTIKLYWPFLVLSFISATAILFSSLVYGDSSKNGLIIFAMTNLFLMLGVCLLDLNLRLRQTKDKNPILKGQWLRTVSAVACILVFASISIIYSIGSNSEAIYALVPSGQETVRKDVANVAPSDLTDEELREEISSPKYQRGLTATEPTIGIYTKTEVASPQPYIRHIFVDWREDRQLAEKILLSQRSNNVALVTIEPKGEDDGNKLLRDIVSSKYDERISAMINTISSTKNTTYVRFAHEMDLGELYPWGAQNPELYKAAYAHVVDLSRNHNAENIKWVWGPAGLESAAAYYPGDNYVDIVGATVLYDQHWSGSYKPSFYELARNRMWMSQYNKPFWITEFGAGNANPETQKQVVQEAVDNYKQLGFSALIYLNIPDSNIPGPDYHFSSTEDLVDVLGLQKNVPQNDKANSSTKLPHEIPSIEYIRKYNQKTMVIHRI